MTFVARWLRRLRWVIVAGWCAAVVVCLTSLPTIRQADSGALGALVPKHADAIKAELASKTQFGFPLLSRTVLVERDPHGMSAERQAEVVHRAVALTRHEVPGFERVAAALPVTNAIGPRRFARERSTTALTYLFFAPDVGVHERAELANRLADERVAPIPDGTVGVTGQAEAVGEQSDVIVQRLPFIELATCLLVALAVGLRFRSVLAPAMTLVTVGVAYVVSSRVIAAVGRSAGVAVPQEVEPVIVVLIFGVVTDYCVFYLSRFRAVLSDGIGRLEAAERTTAQITPLVAAAGITVVAATATLLAAQLEFLRVFGPGLAFSVLVGLAVSLTFVPAFLAVLGSALYWPRRPGRELTHEQAAEDSPTERVGRPTRSRTVNFACRRPWWTIAATVALLVLAANGLWRLHLANPVIRGLPTGASARTAYDAATKGFAPGIISPTVVVVSAPGITHRRTALSRLQRSIARQPGIALVVGPGQQPLPGVRLGATLSRTGDAARLFVVLADDPLGARAIRRVRALRQRMPAMLQRAGLSDAHAAFAGDSALSAETIDKTVADLGRIAPLVLGAILLVLAVYLRALVAPLYLVASSVLAFAAALGIGAYLFGSLTYYVPFASAVLLVSLGSDYNVFLIGRIWQEAEMRPLQEAVPIAASRAASAITTAGLVLAGSFALVALVPLRAFSELAVIVSIGVLLDALLVRTMLVPALMTVVGTVSAWPGGHLGGRKTAVEPRVGSSAA